MSRQIAVNPISVRELNRSIDGDETGNGRDGVLTLTSLDGTEEFIVAVEPNELLECGPDGGTLNLKGFSPFDEPVQYEIEIVATSPDETTDMLLKIG